MLSTFTKEEKQMLFWGLGLVVVAIIVDSYTRNKSKNQESNYRVVMQRGTFQNVAPTPATPPPTTTTPTTTTPSIPSGRVVAPPTPTPTLPIDSGSRVIPPSTPYPMPYPYPYPLPYGSMPYAIIPPMPSVATPAAETAKQSCYKSVVLIGDKEATCFQTRADYTAFLRKTYNTLVDSYNDALYTFAFGRALKVSKAMRKVKNDLANESIII